MKTKVLVVDDDVVSRMVLMHLIDGCGSFDIAEAEDGEDAWQQLSAGLDPAIVFCDLRMPRLSGLELLRRLRGEAAFGALPFVLVTSATDHDTVGQAADFGAAGYIVKPFQADDVSQYMTPFLADTKAAEAPLATMQRLGINSERLLVYLGGFESQLTAAGGELEALLARGDADLVRGRLERLHAGCTTLGLHGAAAALAHCLELPLTRAELHAALAEALAATVQQSATVRQLMAS